MWIGHWFGTRPRKDSVKPALIAGALIALAGSGLTTPAEAAFTFCNRTSYVLASALGVEQKNETVTKGWFILQPGECKVVEQARLEQTTYYSFAYSLPTHQGGTKQFSGSKLLCSGASLATFNIVGQEGCQRRGFAERRYSPVNTQGNADWTTTFAEPKSYSLEEARIAGVQRLLADIGIDAGTVDGFLGAKTRQAILRFKESHDLGTDLSLPSALYQRLIETAQQSSKDAGYSFCNDTGDVVWAAIGFDSDDEVTATGWFRVGPKSCTKVIRDRLRRPVYYTYAEADQKSGPAHVWGGDVRLCTRDDRFTIRGRSDCDQNGFEQAGFARVEVGNKGGYVQRLTGDAARQSSSIRSSTRNDASVSSAP